MKHLTADGSNRIEKTINNVVLVLENDPLLKGSDRATDEFAFADLRGAAMGTQERKKRRWKDVDDAGFYRYMETYYGITGREKLDMGLLIVGSQNKINDVEAIS